MAEKIEDQKKQPTPIEPLPGRNTIWPGIWALSMQAVIEWFYSDERQKHKPKAVAAASRARR